MYKNIFTMSGSPANFWPVWFQPRMRRMAARASTAACTWLILDEILLGTGQFEDGSGILGGAYLLNPLRAIRPSHAVVAQYQKCCSSST